MGIISIAVTVNTPTSTALTDSQSRRVVDVPIGT
jgi:hypothetical protein